LELDNGCGREIAFTCTDQCFGFLKKKNTVTGYKFLLRLSIGMDFL
jgi:hypothetical protein